MYNLVVATDSTERATALGREKSTWSLIAATDASMVRNSIAAGNADVLVLDTSSPWVSEEFMNELATLAPDAVRIALIPEMETWRAVKASRVAHQVLSLRSEPAIVTNVCDRAMSVRSVLNNQPLRALVSSAQHLASPPELWQKLSSTLADQNAGAYDVAAVVGTDAAIAAQVLRLVNSAFFGLSRQVTRLDEAVSLLGFTTIRALVLEAEVNRSVSPVMPGFAHQSVQQHALTVAHVARSIAGKSNAADSFIAGLLVDIGLVLLAAVEPEKLSSAIHEATMQGLALHEVERQIFGYSHGEVGACLLGLWGMPVTVLEAVAHHHELPTFSGLLSVREVIFIARDAAQSAGASDPYDQPGALLRDEDLALDATVAPIVDNARSVATDAVLAKKA